MQTLLPSSRLDTLDCLPCGYLRLSPTGDILHANEAFAGLVQHTIDEVLARSFHHYLSPAGRLLFGTQITASLLLHGFVNEIAMDLKDSAGHQVPVLINARLHQEPAGPEVQLAVFGAVERRRYERELLLSRRAAEQLAEVIQRASDAIVIATPVGVVESWNEGAERMFGLASSRAIGRTLMETARAELSEQDWDSTIALLAAGQTVTRETTATHQQGHTIAVSLSFSPHIEPPGILTSFSLMARDVTSRKLSERALLQNEKLVSVGRLASSIAHEINNPLESVTNLLYILAYQATDPEMKETVRLAQEELARVSQIAVHTLRFHKQASSETVVDFDQLFQSILALYRARLADAGITTIIDRADAGPLLCFEGEVRQAVANLIGNAFDAMRAGGTLRLRHRDATDWRTGTRGVRLSVADTGTGIPAETLKQIFEPFFTTKGIGGTGLGLWITEQLVTKNKGAIRVRSSTSPRSRGTIFSLFLPRP